MPFEYDQIIGGVDAEGAFTHHNACKASVLSGEEVFQPHRSRKEPPRPQPADRPRDGPRAPQRTQTEGQAPDGHSRQVTSRFTPPAAHQRPQPSRGRARSPCRPCAAQRSKSAAQRTTARSAPPTSCRRSLSYSPETLLNVDSLSSFPGSSLLFDFGRLQYSLATILFRLFYSIILLVL